MPTDPTNPPPASMNEAGFNAADVEAFPGLVWAFRFHPDGSAQEITHSASAANIREAGGEEGWLWLHFNLSNVQARANLGEQLEGYPPEAVELLLSSGDHQQLHVREKCIYGIVADLVYRLDGLSDEMGLLHFAAKHTILFTGRRDGLNSLEVVRRKIRSGRPAKSPATLLEMILEKVARGVEKRADDLANEIDTIEERLIVEVRDDHPKELARVRRLAVRLHRLLATQRSMINRFEQHARRASNDTLGLRDRKSVV